MGAGAGAPTQEGASEARARTIVRRNGDGKKGKEGKESTKGANLPRILDRSIPILHDDP